MTMTSNIQNKNPLGLLTLRRIQGQRRLWRLHRMMGPHETIGKDKESKEMNPVDTYRSREQSQPALGYQSATPIINAPPYMFDTPSNVGKFSLQCGLYRRTKIEMLASGWDEVEIFGRHEIDVDTIVLGFMDPQDGQPVSTWSSRTVNRMLQSAPVPIRLASTFLLTKMMKVCR